MFLTRTIFFLTVGLFFSLPLFQCGATVHEDGKGTKIRLINNTSSLYTEVSVFSMAMEDLNPSDTTLYKELKFDPLKDDPLIYCTNGGKRLGRYLQIPDEGAKYVSYVIDSVSNDILYVSYHVDEKY